MARDFFINGETMVLVKGRADSAIGSLTQFGLSDAPIRITPGMRYLDIKVDAWGNVPPEIQFMLSDAIIHMTLVHLDRSVLDTVIQESMGGSPAIGTMGHAGARMGNGLARFAAGGVGGNHFIGLNMSSPIAGKPWRFYYTYLIGNQEFPIGVERSIFNLTFRAVPYTTDPWGVANSFGGGPGLGAFGSPLWDHTLDT